MKAESSFYKLISNLSICQLFDPSQELISPDSFRHRNSASADQRVIRLEALLAEDLFKERLQKSLKLIFLI